LLASERISKADLFKIKIVRTKFVISLWIQVLMHYNIFINFMLFLLEMQQYLDKVETVFFRPVDFDP
jgi:hypothetical protein